MAGEEDRTVSQLYEAQFVPENYISQYYTAVDEEEQFFLSQLHQFFQELKEEKGTTICGARLILTSDCQVSAIKRHWITIVHNQIPKETDFY